MSTTAAAFDVRVLAAGRPVRLVQWTAASAPRSWWPSRADNRLGHRDTLGTSDPQTHRRTDKPAARLRGTRAACMGRRSGRRRSGRRFARPTGAQDGIRSAHPLVADFPVNERNRRRRRFLHLPSPTTRDSSLERAVRAAPNDSRPDDPLRAFARSRSPVVSSQL